MLSSAISHGEENLAGRSGAGPARALGGALAGRPAEAGDRQRDRATFPVYTGETSGIQSGEWTDMLLSFADASLNQAWSMNGHAAAEKGLSHFVLRRDDDIVAIAQVRIRELPWIKGGVATLYWGPLWRRRGGSPDYGVLERMIRALKEEYVSKRGLLLRIWPAGFDDTDEGTVSVLESHGFRRNTAVERYRTLLLDLSPPLEDLRRNLAPKWRNQLKAAERNNLTLTGGSSDELYAVFLHLLHEMLSRKKFKSQVDYDQYRRIQNALAEAVKMKIIVCSSEGQPVSAGVFSAIGEIGTYLLGATSNAGLQVNGSNLLHWTVIQWLKDRNCRWYDLGGIDPAGNPGVYHFKRGIAGKAGKEVTHVGQFYLAGNAAGDAVNACINGLNDVRATFRRYYRSR